eukprot:SAG31_NODE_25433_length_461_cov_1.356354_2_plen_52_part_01
MPPSVLRAGDNTIICLVVDDERNRIYTLNERSQATAYQIGPKGSSWLYRDHW